MKSTKLVLALLMLTYCLVGCSTSVKGGEEDIIELEGIKTYVADVKTVIDGNCKDCHGSTNPAGGVSLVTYDQVKEATENRNLIRLVKRLAFPVMPPPPGAPISDEDIAIIENWKENNFPQE